MKKIFALLLALSLLLSAAALAEHAEEESAPLTREELETLEIADVADILLG